MSLIGSLAKTLGGTQIELFPWLEEELGEIAGTQKKLISILEIIHLEDYVECSASGRGCKNEQQRLPIHRQLGICCDLLCGFILLNLFAIGSIFYYLFEKINRCSIVRYCPVFRT